MSAAGVLTMIVVLGVVWGGFVLSLWKAMRQEAMKRRSGR